MPVFVGAAGVAAFTGWGVAASAIAASAINGVMVGAVIGAATSAMSGGNILEGTLKGALLGGVAGGIGGAIAEGFSVASGLAEGVGASEEVIAGMGPAGDMASVGAEVDASVSAAVNAPGATANLPQTGDLTAMNNLPPGVQPAPAATPAPAAGTPAAATGGGPTAAAKGLIETPGSIAQEYLKQNALMMDKLGTKQIYAGGVTGLAQGALGFLSKGDKEKELEKTFALRSAEVQGNIAANLPMLWKRIVVPKSWRPEYMKTGIATAVAKPLLQGGVA